MVAKISMGSSLYGALAYNGEKINEARGKLLATNKIYNDGTGTVDIGRALNDFLLYMPSQTRVEKPVVHISLNPHSEDRLTDTDLQNIAREYLEKLGFGEQPYMVYKHEDIDRHHVHIVTVNVDENGRRLNCDFLFRRSDRIRRELEEKYGLRPAFNEAKSVGAVGIPCFVLEDGTITLSPEDAGLHSRPINEGATCNIDGSGC